MSTLIIQRTSEWNAKVRDIGIYIDDEKVGIIKDGESLTFNIPEGTHTIKAKIDWCGTNAESFTIIKNETIYFQLSGYKYGNLLFPAMLGIMVLYYLGTYFFDMNMNFLAYVGVLFFMYPLYFLTLGKNKYLVLEKLDK